MGVTIKNSMLNIIRINIHAIEINTKYYRKKKVSNKMCEIVNDK
jgi:hypothetical protein